MMPHVDVTPVIFRTDGEEVIAIFPCEPGDRYGYKMLCYAKMGQHSTCSVEWARSRKHRSATPDEYAELRRELESAPYNYRLKVYRRMRGWMENARRANARR